MNIKIIALGKIKEKFLKDGIDEFLKRLTPYASIEIVELSPIEIKDENLVDKVLEQEGEKILSLISMYAVNSVATLPYDRQEMADYLCIDRASLSRELSKLQKEKILKFKKNKFVLLQETPTI